MFDQPAASAVPPAQDPAKSAQPASEPRFGVLMQYIKDVSFENLDPSGVFLREQPNAQPQINIHFDVKHHAIDQERHEVSLTVRASADIEAKPAYIVEVTYAALVGMQNIPAEHVGPLLNIEVPRLLFPFARALIAELTREANYSALMVNSIDLLQLYQKRLEAQSKHDGATPSAAAPPAGMVT